MDYADPRQAEWALHDPSTPREVLVAIAQAHPALRDRVVTHPNAYPRLVAWIAAQSTSAASLPPQSVGQPQQYGPAQQSYGGPAQPYPMQGQPYGGPGGYPAGPPAKKKTGLVLGLVGGGAVAVVAVVAVLGLFVFHWFGGSSGSGPTLTKSQVTSFLDSDFMQDVSDGISAEDYTYNRLRASDFSGWDGSPSCRGLIDMLSGVDGWTPSSSWIYVSSSISVQRFPKKVSLDSYLNAWNRCEESDASAEDFEDVSIDKQDGGWLATADGEDGAFFLYGNVWLSLSDVTSDEAKDLFKDFVSAVDAAAK